MNEPSLVVAFPGREAFDKGLDDGFYQAFEVARETMQRASDYLGRDVAAMCYEGQKIEERWKSVCLAAHCYAVYRVVAPRLEQPHAFAGYSQGEFTRLRRRGGFLLPGGAGIDLSAGNHSA